MTYPKRTYSRWSLGLAMLAIFVLSVFELTPILPVNAQPNIVNFEIGPGYTDVLTHQIVRSNTDRTFIFAAQAQYSKVLVGYWTTAAGLPTAQSDFNFNNPTTVTESANIISVDAVYNGSSIIHVLINTQSGAVKDYPFDITSNTFKAPLTLANDGGTTPSTGNNTDYIGTGGVSGMVDLNGQLHVAHWTSSNHIVYQAYTYSTGNNTLTPVGNSTTVDTAGHANHPELAVSPHDNSVTVAWVSEANAPTGRILARTRSSSGTWGPVETASASTSDAWTSTSFGINIDQGPSLLIKSDGTKYLTYIQDYDATGFYGKIHFASFNGTSWQDSAVAIAGSNNQLVIGGSTYTHDPALTTNASGQFYIIGHGPVQTNVNENMYTMQRNANGTWAVPSLFKSGSDVNDFDASPSTKWSVVGFNRPNTYEFAFFRAPNKQYNSAELWYGRFGDNTNTVAATATPVQSVPLRNYYTTSTPTLTWNRVTWATSYQIEVASTNAFGATIVYTSPVLTPDTLSLQVPASVLGNGTYYWHVHAMNPNGTWGGWSIPDSFTVAIS